MEFDFRRLLGSAPGPGTTRRDARAIIDPLVHPPVHHAEVFVAVADQLVQLVAVPYVPRPERVVVPPITGSLHDDERVDVEVRPGTRAEVYAGAAPSPAHECLIVTRRHPQLGCVLVVEADTGTWAARNIPGTGEPFAVSLAQALGTCVARTMQAVLLDDVLGHLDVGVSIVDARDRLVFVNRWLAQRSGVLDDPEGAVTPSVRDAVLGRMSEHDVSRIEAMLDTQSAEPAEHLYRVAVTGAGERWHRAQIRTVERRHRMKPPRVVSVVDVHEMVELRRSLAESRDRAVAADSSKAEFLGQLAHTLRTPVGVAAGFFQLIARQPHDPATVSSWAETGSTVTSELVELLDALIEMAGLQAGTVQPSLHPTDPDDVAALARHDARTAVPDVPVELHVRAPVPLVLTDAALLRAALAALLVNAARYAPGPPGPTLTVIGSLDAELGPCATFTVSDAGPGMTTPELDHAQVTFTRLRRHRDRPGHGLGLPMAREIVELLGGRVAITSSPTQGTTATLTIPVSPGYRPAASGQTLGVVSDDPTLVARLTQEADALAGQVSVAAIGPNAEAALGNVIDGPVTVLVDGRTAPAVLAEAFAALDVGPPRVAAVVWLVDDASSVGPIASLEHDALHRSMAEGTELRCIERAAPLEHVLAELNAQHAS